MASTTVLTVVNIVIACSAMLGNGMVIFVMTVRRRQFSSFTNRLIRHQSVIDFVSGVMLLTLKVIKPTEVTLEGEESLWGEVACRFAQADVPLWTVNVASTYNLVVISLERFMATCYPVKHRNSCSLFRIKILMCSTWVVGFVNSLFLLSFFRVDQKVCKFTLENPLTIPLLTLDICIQYLIPVVLMLFTYTRIILVLKKKLAGATDANQQPHANLYKAKQNVIETMLIAVVLFAICWTPFEIFKLKTFISKKISSSTAYIAVTGSLTCNMCVNPIVYCFKYKHFRSQLQKYVREKFRRNRVGTVERSTGPSLVSGTIQKTLLELAVR